MRCGIALGSNIENRLANLREACKRASSLPGVGPPILVSSIYETTPVDCEPGTAPYLNAVMEVNFSGLPVALLEQLLSIEREMGRPSKKPRNSPRKIDLDVLYIGNLVLGSDEFFVPHPRLAQRRFVLTPLAEIVPELILPGHSLSVRALLADLKDPGEVMRLHDPLLNSE
jgi:2-amino-4-hydroxy-6-hydroxymethyldihydropteridine diphosphokinase